jgi:hypothetical protein
MRLIQQPSGPVSTVPLILDLAALMLTRASSPVAGGPYSYSGAMTMADQEQKPDPSKVITVPSTATPAAPKGQPPSDEFVVVEGTQPGRAWIIFGTEVPTKPAPRKT